MGHEAADDPTENFFAHMTQQGWILDTDLWRSGFELGSIELISGKEEVISRMSGLVEVLECVYEAKDDAVVFVVRNKDATKTLFHSDGGLCGVAINGYKPPTQGLVVNATKPKRSPNTTA